MVLVWHVCVTGFIFLVGVDPRRRRRWRNVDPFLFLLESQKESHRVTYISSGHSSPSHILQVLDSTKLPTRMSGSTVQSQVYMIAVIEHTPLFHVHQAWDHYLEPLKLAFALPVCTIQGFPFQSLRV
ncbi:hypothetical protein EDD37DRAFT_321463 [Exophiala viscosa]|uniref:uncharacterized protein n=1 Tax=Exophiala viscosa TaxID=2486360 RepID=UPI00219A61E6|nr:hypothetical protein EDD37DRAFT_321463 [Exophiala viscosa]